MLLEGQNLIGKFIGWMGSFLLFSIILYFVLKFSKKIPEAWGYFPIFTICLLIILVGYYLRKIIK